MTPVVFGNITVSLEACEIAPQLHIEAGSEDFETLSTLLRQACAVARPKAVYTTSFIDDKGDGFVVIAGSKIESRVVRANLDKVHRVFPYVATCGTEVDEWSAGVTDILQNWWMDVVKAHLLGKAIQHLNAHLKDDLKLGKYSNMNPGSLPDWPIAEQPKLFGLIGDVKELIGVTLTDSMLMLPTKSVSGFYFQNESHYENCELCPRDDCPNRRKRFDQEKHARLLGS